MVNFKKEREKRKRKKSWCILWGKEPPERPLSSFSVDRLLLSVLPALKNSLFLPWDSLGENYVFICKWLQLKIASGLGIGLCAHFPFQFQNLIWCRSVHAAPDSMSSCVYQSSWFRRPCFLGVLHLLFPYTSSTSSSAGFCEPWGEEFDGYLPI